MTARGGSTLPAIGVVVIAMLSVQTGASLAKQIFPYTGPRGATAFRLAFAAIIMCAAFRPWRYRLTGPQRRIILAYGVVLGVMNLCFYLALARIPLGVTVALEFTGPLSVALLASRRLLDVVWAILAAIGLVAVSVTTIIAGGAAAATLDLVGVMFALGAGLGWGLYIVFGQRAVRIVPGNVVTSLGMLTAACVAIPFCVWPTSHFVLPDGSGPSLWYLCGVGLAVAVLSSALPYSLEMIGLQRLPAKTFGILMSVEPAIGALLGFFVLHERLLSPQWIGIACVVIASIGSTATATRRLASAPMIGEP